MTNEHFTTEFTSFPQQQGEPQRVGGVAMNGGVERLDREPLVNLVTVGDESEISIVDHRKPLHQGPPDLLAGGLSEESLAWLRSVRETPEQRRHRIRQSLVDHPLRPGQQIRAR